MDNQKSRSSRSASAVGLAVVFLVDVSMAAESKLTSMGVEVSPVGGWDSEMSISDVSPPAVAEEEREGGRERASEDGREGWWETGSEEGREGGCERASERVRMGGRVGGREQVRMGGREGESK